MYGVHPCGDGCLNIDCFVVGEETFVGAQCKTFIQAVVDGRIGLDEVLL